jgi:hypothetical protein
MSRWRQVRVVGTIVVSAAVGLAAAQTPAPRPATSGQAPLPAGGLILGQIVDAGSSQGIPGVTVTLTGGSGPGAVVDERLMAQFEKGLVSAEQLGRGGTRRVITDAEGRFLFRDLTRGSYAATATLEGYSSGAFGQRRPDGPTRPVELADNEKVVNAVIRMWKLAAISGRVVDEAGEPVVGHGVRALRRSYSGGRPRISAAVTGYTDDRGTYRIASLPPGDYFVGVPFGVTTYPAVSVDLEREARASGAALPADLLIQRNESGVPALTTGMRVGDLIVQTGIGTNRSVAVHSTSADVRMMVYPTSFYPGTATLTQATAVTVGSGEQRQGIDLVLRPSPATSVSGILTGPDGPAGNQGLRLFPADVSRIMGDGGFVAATASTDATGRFTFLGVPAGQYVLRAYRVARGDLVVNQESPGAAGATGARGRGAGEVMGPTLWADMPVAVGDAPVVDLAVTLRPGAVVSGHVAFDGTAARPTPEQLRAISISIAPADGRTPPATLPPTRVDANGRFTLPGYPPGAYIITTSSPARDWVVRSIMAGSTNAWEQPLVLEAADIGNVVVTYTDRPAELSGTLQGIPANSDEIFSVLIFPADYQAWIANGMMMRRMVPASVTKAGTFQVRLPMPGEYLAVAKSQDIAAEMTAEYFASIARSATRVSIAEGEKKSISLPVTPIK